jgi:hypothetical protein
LTRYNVSEEKLITVLDAIDKVPNQRLYKYLKSTIEDLKVSYAF